MALCYLNRGLILEQAISALVRKYFCDLHLDNTYKNFHITVTTEHPFARLYMNDSLSASDSFPCVVVSTQEDRKPDAFVNLSPHIEAIGITASDLDIITKSTRTVKNADGSEREEDIAGLCTVCDEEGIKAVKDVIDAQGYCYGWSCRIRRCDTLCIEVWAENVQLKNEIYEQLRLFVAGNMRCLLDSIYSFFDIALFDNTIIGHRSNNWNLDFDVPLSGAHILFNINYCIEQVVLDTALKTVNAEIIQNTASHL